MTDVVGFLLCVCVREGEGERERERVEDVLARVCAVSILMKTTEKN